jgi:hypothetical protein
MDKLEQNVPAVVSAPVVSYGRYLDASAADYDDVTSVLRACTSANTRAR